MMAKSRSIWSMALVLGYTINGMALELVLQQIDYDNSGMRCK